MIGFTQMTVEHDPARGPVAQPEKPWALDGSSGGTGKSRSDLDLAAREAQHAWCRPRPALARVAAKYDRVARVEARHATSHAQDARHLVVSFGTTGSFVDYVVDELRAEGHAVSTFRPITLWPFPAQVVTDAASHVRTVRSSSRTPAR